MRRRRRPTLHHAVKDKRVTVLGPVKQPEMDFMSHGGGGGDKKRLMQELEESTAQGWMVAYTDGSAGRWMHASMVAGVVWRAISKESPQSCNST